MYEETFGLKKSPFREKATGGTVFVGPQTAKTMAGFRKALTVQDAVVTVSGLAGTGKTTLVARSVDAIDVRKKIVRVSRMRMNAGDVLESLLIVLGVDNYPSGTIQRFTALRRKMKEFEDSGVRVFIVVEDALRTGVETLAEIEALTAEDAGESGGASIVLMGDERLEDFMKDPQLAQLQHRVRQRHRIAPLCVAELRGYLRHCFRVVGGDFDQIFDNKSCDLLHRLSDGVPRITNTIVEASLHAAAEQGIKPVTAELVAKVAADEFQLDAGDFDFSGDEVVEPDPAHEALEPVAEQEPVEESAPAPEPEPVSQPIAEPELQPGTTPQPAAESSPGPEPVIVFADEDAPENDDVPELIQDTLPEIAILAPELAATEEEPAEDLAATEEEPVEDFAEPVEQPTVDIPELELDNAAKSIADDIPELEPDPALQAEPVHEPEPAPKSESAPQPEPVHEPEPASIPELSLVAEDSSGDEVPDWERDPTLAELKPDLDALEQAMAVAHGANTPLPDADEDHRETTLIEEQPREEIPEITLDNSIRTGIEQHLVEDTATDLPKRKPLQADAELEKIAAELAKAKTIEDVDDKMAETLFGSEISMIAAQVVGNPAIGQSANDELQPASGEEEPEDDEPGAPGKVAEPKGDLPNLEQISEEVFIETKTEMPPTGMDLSASQRLKAVRALNADLPPSLRGSGNEPLNGGSAAEDSPVSIEDQINTSITETLKALKVPLSVANEEPEEDSGKSGFFSRFKRS